MQSDTFVFNSLCFAVICLPPSWCEQSRPGFFFFLQAELVHRAAGYPSVMSEGEAKQAPAPTSTMEAKSEAAAAAPTGQGVSSVSSPVSTVTQAPPAPTTATEDEEEESEDESEILEESPCGRWQKRREEVP